MNKLLFALAISAGLILVAQAQVNAPPGSPTICVNTARFDAATAGNLEIVAARTGAKIYICGYTLWGGGTTTVQLLSGTGTNCATSQTVVTPGFQVAVGGGVMDSSPFNRGLITTESHALCFRNASPVSAQGIIYYGQYLTQ